MNSPSEKEIQSAILDYLRLKKVGCWRAGSGAFRVEDRSVGYHRLPEQAPFITDVTKSGGAARDGHSIDDVAAQRI